MRKGKRALLLAVLTMVSAVTAAPAYADSPRDTTTSKATVRLVPANASAGRPTSPAEKSEAKQSAEADKQRPAAPDVPLQRALDHQRAANQFHDVLLTDRGNSRLAVEPSEDWPTRDECIQEYTESDFEGEWQFHNNYSACQVYNVYFDFEECTTSQPCTPVGQTEARAVILGKGYAKTRAVDWDIYLDSWRLVWGREIPNLQFKIDVECATYESTDRCTSSSAHNTRTLAEWKINGLHNIFTDTETPTAWPGDKKPQDKRAYFQYKPTVTSLSTGIPRNTYPVVSRCDNAAYVTGAACIFPGTWSRFIMDYNYPNYKESVEFIWDAMHDLESVKPGSAGLYVPGGFYTQPITGGLVPLTRNYYGTQSRTRVQAECVRLFGANYTQGPNGVIRDCDEYPFASTYQSANYDTVGTASTWAVKALDRSHNRSAGSILGDYYVLDHILDEDPFFVHIINGPGE
jgi:hypothetical protein